MGLFPSMGELLVPRIFSSKSCILHSQRRRRERERGILLLQLLTFSEQTNKTSFQTVQDITSCLRYTEKGVFSFFKKKNTHTHFWASKFWSVSLSINVQPDDEDHTSEPKRKKVLLHVRPNFLTADATATGTTSTHTQLLHRLTDQLLRRRIEVRGPATLCTVCVCVRVRKRAGGWAAAVGGEGLYLDI